MDETEQEERPTIGRFTYWAQDPVNSGALFAVFSIFAQRVPTSAEVRTLQHNIMAQTRSVNMPRVVAFSVEELHPFDCEMALATTKELPMGGD